MADNTPVRAIILVGGPTRGTRFRPLSLNIAKPLFPLAGKPMIWHHIEACKSQLPGLREVLLLGTFPDNVFKDFIEQTSDALNVKIEYLKETEFLGTAGGLWAHKQRITSDIEYFFVLHSDICCSFPLQAILQFHKSHGKNVTILGTKVPKDIAAGFGCYVADEKTNRMVHYTERPESYISDTINAGVYCFSKAVLSLSIRRTPSKNEIDLLSPETPSNALSMERDVLPHLVEDSQIYVYQLTDAWRSVKNPGSALYCNELYLKSYVKSHPERLRKGANIIGNVVIDPSAQVDPTAKIGPNVYIGQKVVIGKGVRIHDAIILENTDIKNRACLLYTIVSSECSVGAWARVEGLPTATALTSPTSPKQNGITTLGNGVNVSAEVIIRNCVVMPHKDLGSSYFNEILL